MKRILLINNGYPSILRPNYCTYIQTIEGCIKQAGFDVKKLVIKYNKQGLLYKICCYLLFYVHLLSIKISNYDTLYVHHPPFALPLFFRKGSYKKQLILHWHGNELVTNGWYIRFCLSYLRPRVKKLVHVVPSEYFKSRLIASMGVNSKNIIVSPSGGVNISQFSPKPNQKVLESPISIGFCSALTHSKNAHIILGLAHKADMLESITGISIHFQIIDYGAESDYFVKRIESEKLPFTIFPKMPKNEMPHFYQTCDIMLMPSMSESLGLVVLEAMSCGIPVITFETCAFPEFVIPDLSGELVSYSNNTEINIERYIDKISKVVKNYQGYSPRTYVEERYSEKYVINQYHDIFK